MPMWRKSVALPFEHDANVQIKKKRINIIISSYFDLIYEGGWLQEWNH